MQVSLIDHFSFKARLLWQFMEMAEAAVAAAEMVAMTREAAMAIEDKGERRWHIRTMGGLEGVRRLVEFRKAANELMVRCVEKHRCWRGCEGSEGRCN
jgi:hypothetical protein